jgi:transposase-like protein
MTSPLPIPHTLIEFQHQFPDEAVCADFLERVKWPEGFACPACGVFGEPYRIATRPAVLQCRACMAQTSLTAGTVMHGTRTPLQVWFWAAYLVTSETPGMSALQFQRQLGVKRYETAFQMLHKLRAAMIRPDRDQVGGEYPVEIDEAFVGGRTRGQGRGVTHANIIVGAVEVRERREGEDRAATARMEHRGGIPLKRKTYAGRLRLRHIVTRGREELEPFVREAILPGTFVYTDGWQGYEHIGSMGFQHIPMVVKGDPERLDAHLPMVHLVFSNLKTWLLGTFHGVSPQHLQAYLNEYVFRFNRRFYPMSAFAKVLGIAMKATGPTYEGLYQGHWEHRRNPGREVPLPGLRPASRLTARGR